MTADDTRLDGNAAAGVLREVFGTEVTASAGTCAHCGADGHVGEMIVYLSAPGLVVRCPSCGGVLITVVHGRGRLFVNLTGVRRLEIRI